MKKLIVYIEYAAAEQRKLITQIDAALAALPHNSVGWRVFGSLEDAARWERGDIGIEQVEIH